MSDQPKRASVSLNQAPTLNAKVEQLRAEFAAEHPSPPASQARDHGLGSAGASPSREEPLRERIVAALETIYDPEIPVNIYDLGLIYAIDIDAASNVHVRMTLTAPGCPVADQIVREVQEKVRSTPGVASAKIELVWSPPWEKSRMSEAALLELGLL